MKGVRHGGREGDTDDAAPRNESARAAEPLPTAALTPQQVLRLQSCLGNAAVARLLQRQPEEEALIDEEEWEEEDEAEEPQPAVARAPLLQRARTKGTPRRKRVPRGRAPQKAELWARLLSERLQVGPAVGRALSAAADSNRPVEDVEQLYLGKPANYGTADVVTLARVQNRTVADLLALAAHPFGLTAAQAARIARAGRTAAELTALTQAPYGLNQADAVTLAGVPGRSMAELNTLAAAVTVPGGPPRPVNEIAALAGESIPANRITAGEAVTLAQGPGTLQTLENLLRHGLNLPAAQVGQIAAANHDAADLSVLVAAPHSLQPADAVALLSIPGRLQAHILQLLQNRPAHRPVSELAQLAAVQRLSVAEVTTVANVPGRSTNDLVALLGHPFNLTGAETDAIGRAGHAAADLDTLRQPPHSLPRADVVALTSIPGRNMGDLTQLLQNKPAHRSVDEIAQLAALGAPAHRLDVPGVTTVAGVPGRTVPELTGLLGHALNLTAAQVDAVGRAGRVPADLDTLTQPPHGLQPLEAVAMASVPGRTMPNLVQLLQNRPPGCSIDTLAALAGHGAPAHSLTLPQVIQLAAITHRPQADLLTLAGAVPTLAGRTVADLVMLANHGAPAARISAGDAATVLGPGGLGAPFTTANIITLFDHLGGLTAVQVMQVAGALQPLNVANRLALLAQLRQAQVTADDIHALVQAFSAAGENGAQIRHRLNQLWATYHVADARDITRPKRVGPPVVAAGTRILTGTMVVQQLRALLAVAPPAMGTLTQDVGLYPTGQNPAGLGSAQLWLDCAPGNVPVRVGGGGPETADEAQIRQRLALAQLMNPGRFGYVPGIVQQIFAFTHGQRPRSIKAPGSEDTLGAAFGAHIVDRHVLNGAGNIKDIDDLAMRAAGYRVNPHSPAGAFNTTADARTAMQAALNQMLTVPATDWVWLRNQLAQGNAVQQNVGGVAANGERADRVGGAIAVWDLPVYTVPGGSGIRPLHNRHNYDAQAAGAGKWQVWAPPAGDGHTYLLRFDGAWRLPYVRRALLAPGAALVNLTANPGAGVTIRLQAADVEGGFCVHSAWPY